MPPMAAFAAPAYPLARAVPAAMIALPCPRAPAIRVLAILPDVWAPSVAVAVVAPWPGATMPPCPDAYPLPLP